ncbi:MAG: 30S ribosomal protein S8 [Bdellovibrionales bacterium RBG_16_40_8]|nr:MAG: 30S ribosomal protein S8 [Bdellovibrionales bacterium RBG_16_40_8]
MDTVAQFLTRIRNAGNAKHEKVDVPCSNLRAGIANVLQKNGYIRSFKVVRDGKQGMMRIYLRYNSQGKPVINTLNRISSSGLRRYIGVKDIPRVRNGFGIAVLSTSKGILSGEEAIEQKLGGELLFQVW